MPGVRPTALSDGLRRARHNHFATAGAAFGPDVNDPVSCFDHVQIVLDDQHGVAGFDKVLQNVQQQLNVGKMQTGGRFVQQVQCLSRAAFNQFPCQLDSLGLATRKRWRRLADLQIIQTNAVQGFQFVQDNGNILEKLHRLLDVHIQDVGDRLAIEFHLQCFAIEPLAFANGTGDPNIR